MNGQGKRICRKSRVTYDVIFFTLRAKKETQWPKSLMRLKYFTSHSLYKNKSNMNNESLLNIIFSFKTLVVLFILNEKNYNRWLNSLLVKKWLNYTYLYGIHWKDFQLRRLPNAWKLCIYIAYTIVIFHFILETFYELEMQTILNYLC